MLTRTTPVHNRHYAALVITHKCRYVRRSIGRRIGILYLRNGAAITSMVGRPSTDRRSALGPVERLGCLVEFGVDPGKDHRQGGTPCRNPLQV